MTRNEWWMAGVVALVVAGAVVMAGQVATSWAADSPTGAPALAPGEWKLNELGVMIAATATATPGEPVRVKLVATGQPGRTMSIPVDATLSQTRVSMMSRAMPRPTTVGSASCVVRLNDEGKGEAEIVFETAVSPTTQPDRAAAGKPSTQPDAAELATLIQKANTSATSQANGGLGEMVTTYRVTLRSALDSKAVGTMAFHPAVQ